MEDKNKIIKNLFWQIWDKIVILILEFFVGIKIANYFGVKMYGVYSYSLSLVLFSRISYELINKRVVIKEYLTEEDNLVIELATFYKVLIGLAITLILYIYVQDLEIRKIVLVLAIIEVVRAYSFKYEVYSEINFNIKMYVIINNITKIIIYLLQYFLILLNKNIYTIILLSLFGEFFRVFLLVKILPNYGKKKLDRKIIVRKFKPLLEESFYFFIGYIYFIVFTQIDKIMLGYYISKEYVGIYNIAVQLTNVLAIFFVPIQNTLYPLLIKINQQSEKKYLELWQDYNTIITYLYLILTILSVFVVKYTFNYIFSNEYIESIKVYNILALMVFLKANTILRMIHINIYDLGKILLKLSFIGIVLNIILNYIFLLKFGMLGVAVASVITQLFVGNILYFFFKEGKIIFKIQYKSFNPFNLWILIKKYNKSKYFY